MNNKPIKQEPVAWMVEDEFDISFIMNGKGLAKPDASWKSVIPVFTHPKELSDEEIWETIVEEMGEFYKDNQDAFELCKSVLRKASE